MANEIQVRSSLQIKNGNQFYQSQPTAFVADQGTAGGPTPGMLLVSQLGTAVSLAQLTALGGLCWMQNLDPTNYVEYGVYDPDTNEFFPLGEILAGECYTLRLSRFLGSEFGTGTSGTATTGSGVQFMLKAVGGDCQVIVDAFNK